VFPASDCRKSFRSLLTLLTYIPVAVGYASRTLIGIRFPSWCLRHFDGYRLDLPGFKNLEGLPIGLFPASRLFRLPEAASGPEALLNRGRMNKISNFPAACQKLAQLSI
jgi:hypothetical protein